jgi:hypothetical protein
LRIQVPQNRGIARLAGTVANSMTGRQNLPTQPERNLVARAFSQENPSTLVRWHRRRRVATSSETSNVGRKSVTSIL